MPKIQFLKNSIKKIIFGRLSGKNPENWVLKNLVFKKFIISESEWWKIEIQKVEYW